MKSCLSLISKLLLVTITIYAFFSLISVYEFSDVSSTIINQSSTDSVNPTILINTTKVSNCIPNYTSKDDNSQDSLSPQNPKLDGIKSDENKGICKILRVSDSFNCTEYMGNNSEIPCEVSDDAISHNELRPDNFGDNGHLLADTKFNQQYSFELNDPINDNNKFRVTMDFNKHTQSENSKINSPRIEIVREDSKGNPDMTAAKNQEIVWHGNIHEYFKEPKGKFENETYISLQFNTGHHGSHDNDQERGFGVLFDVSGDSNPNLLEYRDNGKYVKYDYNSMKQLAGDSFIFHQLDSDGKPKFINNLTNKANVELKVKTFLTDLNTRTVETFIDNGVGNEIPYWTLNNLSKLKEQDGINDENGFMETINQGSGYVIARTDNIDTRPDSFKSLLFNV